MLPRRPEESLFRSNASCERAAASVERKSQVSVGRRFETHLHSKRSPRRVDVCNFTLKQIRLGDHVMTWSMNFKLISRLNNCHYIRSLCCSSFHAPPTVGEVRRRHESDCNHGPWRIKRHSCRPYTCGVSELAAVANEKQCSALSSAVRGSRTSTMHKPRESIVGGLFSEDSTAWKIS